LGAANQHPTSAPVPARDWSLTLISRGGLESFVDSLLRLGVSQ
jgi:hypothetical protein